MGFEKDMEAFKAAGGEVAKEIRALRTEKRKEKEGKKKKDPNAPKRPQSAYSIFLSENREAILKSLPAGASPITDVAKKAGEQWKALSAAAKKPTRQRPRRQRLSTRRRWKSTRRRMVTTQLMTMRRKTRQKRSPRRGLARLAPELSRAEN